jgi:predicted RNase H-like HicB family nuclease
MQPVARVFRFSFGVRLDPDEDNTFHGWVPALRGVHTFGDTEEETLAGLREAAQLHVEYLLRERLPVPADTSLLAASQIVEVVVPWAMLSQG